MRNKGEELEKTVRLSPGTQKEIIGKDILAEERSEGGNIVAPLTDQSATHSRITAQPATLPPPQPSRKPWKLAIICGILLSLLLLVVVPVIGIGRAVNNLLSTGEKLNSALASQDLGAVKTNISQLGGDLSGFDKSLTPLIWVRFIPFIGGYWQDAKNLAMGGKAATQAVELLIPAIEPYADILGFNPSKISGQVAADGAKTAEERIDFIVASLPEILPKLDPVGEKLKVADQKLTQIDPQRYPGELRGIKIRDKITDIKSTVSSIKTFVTDGKPLLEVMPYLLGIPSERTYLVVFQNDKELRPTGGFMTAYSLMKVKGGKIQPVISDDIYNLDKRYKAALTAPKPFIDHIKQPYSANPNWRLRDMNWSPDFKDATNLFLEEAGKARLPKVDGVIAVDTNVLVYILQVTGQIGVPGQGNFSADLDSRCNCPQVIYELETYADVEKPIVWDPNTGKIVFGKIVDNRKAILGPLVNSVVANALAQPRGKVPSLVGAILKSLQEKNVLLYMFDEKAQKAVEAFNIGGRIREGDGDYLAIVDANLGGRKSNLYVIQEVSDNIKVERDKIVHNLTITYKNPQPHDGWLNSVLPNYMRVYVPKGAKLVSSSGIDGEIERREEFTKTVFGGFFQLRPLGVAKIQILYEIPNPGRSPYTLLVRKQPGTIPFSYSIEVGGKTEEFSLVSDRELHF